MSGDAGRSLAWRMPRGFSRRPSHCWDAEGDGAALHWVGPWVNLASAFESAGMQRGRQVKHAAMSRQLGYPDCVEIVLGQAHFIAWKCCRIAPRCCRVLGVDECVAQMSQACHEMRLTPEGRNVRGRRA